MFQLLSRCFAYLLLLLLPLQGLAASNATICNSVKQPAASVQKANMPHCNMPMADAKQSTKKPLDHQDNQHKTQCDNLCANLTAMTVMPAISTLAHPQLAATLLPKNQAIYISITLASLQRPPIYLS